MKKNNIFLFFPLLGITAQAQNVGINTITPQTKLHVVGDLQLTNELALAKTAGGVSSAGSSGDFLMSRGAGRSPEWKKIEEAFIPQEAGFMKLSTTRNASADVLTNVRFNENVLQVSKYATISSNKEYFTIQKAGFYYVTAYLRYEMMPNPSGGNTQATTHIYKNGESFTSVSGDITNTDTEAYHSVSIVQQFNVGDKIYLKGSFKRQSSFVEGFLTLQYFGSN
ncbi:hypothetical protein [Bergeyella zoohelcum]|uniref:C1q domain-containing protein n=1 Tax=Bergeyella zoohelcum TaxID=1015 RepID=A0A376BY41_9FLAO|nr:hypothetical protein [Bergeyella zoohelcum]EKB60402.1 hypothetical protein HMPREF9700_00956 [Bergeyella zoohelcum CCUG 30536]SSZ46447.1 Uncharacterised protein [Bergeyella zoohelcum]